MRRGEVAKHQLRRLLNLGALPDLIDIVGAGGDLARFVIRQHIVHQPLIQGQLTPVVGNEQHIVHVAADHLVPNLFGPFRQGRNHLALRLGGL